MIKNAKALMKVIIQCTKVVITLGDYRVLKNLVADGANKVMVFSQEALILKSWTRHGLKI